MKVDRSLRVIINPSSILDFEISGVFPWHKSKIQPGDEVLKSVERVNAGKAYFKGSMVELGFRVLHGEGNFTHVAFAEKQSQIFKALDSLVLFRKDFKDPCLSGFSRFSTAPISMMSKVVDRIKEAL